MVSDNARSGMQQAPHRSLFNALGMTEEEMNNLSFDSVSEIKQSKQQ